MEIAYIGETIFFAEVRAMGQVWVARSIYNSIYFMELDETGRSLPVWSLEERVVEYLKNAHLVGPKYEPYAVPVEVFINAWLSDKSMDIAELQINPDGKSDTALILDNEEFNASKIAA